MVQTFRPEFVTSVPCTVFCGGNILPAMFFEKSQLAGAWILLLPGDVPQFRSV